MGQLDHRVRLDTLDYTDDGPVVPLVTPLRSDPPLLIADRRKLVELRGFPRIPDEPAAPRLDVLLREQMLKERARRQIARVRRRANAFAGLAFALGIAVGSILNGSSLVVRALALFHVVR